MISKDPYVDENGVLINLLGIKDADRLKQAEVDLTLIKIITAGKNYSNKFDTKFIRDLHKHIFGDIYPWAGEYRTIPLYKTEAVIPGLSLEYSKPKNIEKELEAYLKIFNSTVWENMSIEEKSKRFTILLAKMWRVHPFRDGNTRTMVTFGYLFSRSHDFPLDLSYLLPNIRRVYGENGRIVKYSIRDKLVLASLDEKDYPEPEHLNRIILSSMQSGIKKKEEAENSYRE